MTDEALYHDPEFAALYDYDNPWPEDFDHFLTLVSGRRVLDLGCGTGIFSAALAARGHQVTGVDPAAAMLELARRRDGQVTWINADARGLDLGQRFDMVVMTGHAFQTLLTRADRQAVIATIARHLVAGGRFFFDSRNPDARAWDRWTKAATLGNFRHPDRGQITRWTTASQDDSGIVSYETVYQYDDGRQLRATSRLGFPDRSEIAGLIGAAGMQVERWIGDVSLSDFAPDSPEIIPLGRRPA